MRHQTIRKISLLMALILLVLPSTAALATDDIITPAYYDTITVTEGVVEVDYKVNVRKAANKNAGRVTTLSPGDTVIVLGQEGDWYRVQVNGQEGYVLSDLLTVRTYEDQVARIDEAAFEASIDNVDYPVFLERKASYTLKGVITSTLPITLVKVTVINQITMQEEMTASESLSRAQNITEYNLVKLDNYLKFRKLTSGEKRLVVTVQSDTASRDVLDVIFHVSGATTAQPTSVTASCQITVDHDKAAHLTDDKMGTVWSPSSDSDALSITLPNDSALYALTFTFAKPIAYLRLDCYSTSGELLDSLEETYSSRRYATSHTLPGSTARVVMTTNDLSASLAELRVYNQDVISSLVQMWSNDSEKVNAMLICANPGDEFLYFGGLLPYCADAGRSLETVFMTGSDRDTVAQSLAAIWASGIDRAPAFLGLESKNVGKYEDAVTLWDLESTVAALVTEIRATQPDVIITHNMEGENGNHQRTYTATLVRRAVLLAADPESYPESYAQYGAWDVKKLYFHQYAANTIEMDWSMNLQKFGLSAEQSAELAFSHYTSLSKFSVSKYNRDFEAGSYGLIYTTVGEDEAKNDLFEHID